MASPKHISGKLGELSPVKIMFYGSLDSSSPVHNDVVMNLKALIRFMARERAHFVVRGVVAAAGASIIPVDAFVLDALRESSAGSRKAAVTVIHEPNEVASVSAGIPVISYTASSRNRVHFYSEILKLSDLVIGVGGQLGLIRMAISCEWLRHPFIALPGSGGTAELLWSETFAKSFQIRSFPESLTDNVKQMPYISCPDKAYAQRTYQTFCNFMEGAHKYGIGVSPASEESIAFGEISLSKAVSHLKRLSIEAWIALCSIFATLLSTAYYLGSKNILGFLTDRTLHK